MVDPDTPGDYSYNVTCGSEPCSDKATGTVTVVEACTATAPDFSICAGTTVNDQLFEDHGASCSVGCNMTLDYSFDGSSAGIYSYNVTCNGGACGDDVSTGNVTVIECAGPLLTISKSDFPDPVRRGGTLTYTIIISNNGAANATGVNVVDDYDETILTITDAGDGTVSEPPDTITWNGE